MKIRKEHPRDHAEVYDLVKKSFATCDDDDGATPDYLNGLRGKSSFVPELSLVAEGEGGRLVGQVALCETDVAAPGAKIAALVLSPICVHPDCFGRGIARALMERAFEIAEGLGYAAVFLCGDPRFYRKIGFVPTCEHGIYHVADAERNAEWCMVRELTRGALKGASGTVDIV